MSRFLGLRFLIAIVGGAAIAYAALPVVADGLARIDSIRALVAKPWPAWTDPLVGGGIILAGLLLWALIGSTIWLLLRDRPNGPPAAG